MRFTSNLQHRVALSFLVSALLLATLLVISPSGHASESSINREQAIAIVKQYHSGKVLKAQRETSRFGDIFAIKILTPKGRIKVIRVNAQNGKLLRQEHRETGPKNQIKKQRKIKQEKFKR